MNTSVRLLLFMNLLTLGLVIGRLSSSAFAGEDSSMPKELSAAWASNHSLYEVSLWKSYDLLNPRLRSGTFSSLARVLSVLDPEFGAKLRAAQEHSANSFYLSCGIPSLRERLHAADGELMLRIDGKLAEESNVVISNITPVLKIRSLSSPLIYEGGVVSRLLSLPDYLKRKRGNGKVASIEVEYSPIWSREKGAGWAFLVSIHHLGGSGDGSKAISFTYSALTELQPLRVREQEAALRDGSLRLLRTDDSGLEEPRHEPMFSFIGSEGSGYYFGK